MVSGRMQLMLSRQCSASARTPRDPFLLNSVHGDGKIAHQFWRQVIGEQVDEVAKGFGGAIALGGLEQKIHQRVADQPHRSIDHRAVDIAICCPQRSKPSCTASAVTGSSFKGVRG